MDSGIYRLTYKTGETYVGKSIHLNTRWKQHFDKLSKGKAAKEMQDAFNASNGEFPKTEVLVYCHRDMLDYYEGYFINYLKPPLNTQIPDALPPEEQEILVRHANRGFAVYSVVTMIEVLEQYSTERVELREEFEQLELDYHELSQSWSNRAVRDNWASEEYRNAVDGYGEVEAERDYLEGELELLQSWQLRVTRANWWQRLWQLW
jgi:hypothetical protein